MKALVDFLYEAGFLKRLARTGYPFLGSGDESVADHTCRTLFVAYVLGQLAGDVDMGKLLKMCLFHDFPEARMGDLNYVQKQYVEPNEEKILSELSDRLPFGEEVACLVREFNERETREAILANDADQLDLLFHVKEQADSGNRQTGPWLEYAYQRLSTETARKLARLAMETDSTDWWLAGRKDTRKT